MSNLELLPVSPVALFPQVSPVALDQAEGRRNHDTNIRSDRVRRDVYWSGGGHLDGIARPLLMRTTLVEF